MKWTDAMAASEEEPIAAEGVRSARNAIVSEEDDVGGCVPMKWTNAIVVSEEESTAAELDTELDNMSGEDTDSAPPPSMRQSTDDEDTLPMEPTTSDLPDKDTLPMEPTTSDLPKPQDDQDCWCGQSADDWANLFGLDMSVPHAQDMPHAANICTRLGSAGIPRVSERPMGWAVKNGSKMRDIVHLSCHACLTPAEKELHTANIIVFFANAKSNAVFLLRGPRTRRQGSWAFVWWGSRSRANSADRRADGMEAEVCGAPEQTTYVLQERQSGLDERAAASQSE